MRESGMSPAPPILTPPHRAQYPVASIVLPWLPPGTCVLYAGTAAAVFPRTVRNPPQVHHTHSPCPLPLSGGGSVVSAAPTDCIRCAGSNPTEHVYMRATRGHPLPILSPQRHIILTARPLDCCSRPRAQHGVRVRIGVSGSPQETEGRHVPRRSLLSLPRHKQGRRHLQDR